MLWRKSKRIRDLERYIAHLQFRCDHDILTNLLNRSGLKHTLDRWCEEGIPQVTVWLLDIDNFKLLNDNHTHEYGDFVLTELAATIRAISRPLGRAFRLSGDEFAVIIPLLEVGANDAVASRIIESVSGLEIQRHSQPELAVSIGQCEGKPEEYAELIRKADCAAYHSKLVQGSCNTVYYDGMVMPSQNQPSDYGDRRKRPNYS